MTPAKGKHTAVRRALSMMGDLEVTVDNLKASLPPAEMNKLQGSFRSRLNESQNEAYKGKGLTKEEKAQWMLQYVLDPEQV